jgi:hypothetical protein
MTVKELKEKIADMPDNMDVFLTHMPTDFQYGLLEEVEQKKISFYEKVGGRPLAQDTVIVLLHS